MSILLSFFQMIGKVDWIIMQVKHLDQDQDVHIKIETKETEWILNKPTEKPNPQFISYRNPLQIVFEGFVE